MSSLFKPKSSKENVSSETKIPPWLEQGSKDALGLARDIADQPYQRYTGDRVAPLSSNQTKAIDLAETSPGVWGPKMSEATSLARRSGDSFLNADINAYMNPYLRGVLDPAIADMSRAYQQSEMSRKASAVSTGAFANNRTNVTDDYEKYIEGIGDLSAQANYAAFSDAASRFDADRAAAGKSSAALSSLSSNESALISADLDRLLVTGGLKQAHEQAGLDVAYSDYLEQRDWDFRGLDALIRAVSGVPYGTKTEGEQIVSGGSPLAQLAGAGATVYGGYKLFNS